MKFEEGKLYTERKGTCAYESILRFDHYEYNKSILVFSIVKNGGYIIYSGGVIKMKSDEVKLEEWRNDVLPDNTEFDEWISENLFKGFKAADNDIVREARSTMVEGDVDNLVKKDDVESLKRRLKAIDTALKMGGSMNDLLDKRIETINKLELIS